MTHEPRASSGYDADGKPIGRPKVLDVLTSELYAIYEEYGELDGYQFAAKVLDGGLHQWRAMHEHPKSYETICKWRHDLLIHKENKALAKIEALLESEDPGVALRAAGQLRGYVKDMRAALKDPAAPSHLMITKRNPLLKDITPADKSTIIDLDPVTDEDLERLGLT